jgi:sigma-B regulation protein RsbU (phosphoserine phosphatase)
MKRVLVVEDEPGIALVLEDSLRLEGHYVELLSDGLAAARQVREREFDLILLDGMLPGKDGFDVCHELRRAGVKTPVIFLSARGEVADRIRGLDLGANDYVVKPFSPHELMARVRRHLQREQETRDEQRHLEDEIHGASAVQQRLFPQFQPIVPKIDYAAVCRPAREVSGDYYDFIDLGDGRLGLLLADVCGKGMPAALLGASLHAAIRSYAAAAGDNCGVLLARTNRLLFETTAPERYATVFYGVYDPSTDTLTYSNAGHYAPWVVSNSGRTVRLDSMTPPLGMFPEIASLHRTVHLAATDWLLLCSDGIPETCDPSGREFGDNGLLAVLQHSPGSALGFCTKAIAAVIEFAQASPPGDDLTLIAAHVTA